MQKHGKTLPYTFFLHGIYVQQNPSYHRNILKLALLEIITWCQETSKSNTGNTLPWLFWTYVVLEFITGQTRLYQDEQVSVTTTKINVLPVDPYHCKDFDSIQKAPRNAPTVVHLAPCIKNYLSQSYKYWEKLWMDPLINEQQLRIHNKHIPRSHDCHNILNNLQFFKLWYVCSFFSKMVFP